MSTKRDALEKEFDAWLEMVPRNYLPGWVNRTCAHKWENTFRRRERPSERWRMCFRCCMASPMPPPSTVL